MCLFKNQITSNRSAPLKKHFFLIFEKSRKPHKNMSLPIGFHVPKRKDQLNAKRYETVQFRGSFLWKTILGASKQEHDASLVGQQGRGPSHPVKKLLEKSWFVLFLCLVCAALFMVVAIVVVDVLQQSSFTPSDLTGRGTFILSSFHDLRDVIAYGYNASSPDAPSSSQRLLGSEGVVSELRSLFFLPSSRALLLVQALTSDSAILILPNACVGTSGLRMFSSRGAPLFHPYAVALDESNNRLYVTNQNSGDIIILDPQSGTPRHPDPVFATLEQPRAVVVSDVTKKVYACSADENAMIEFDHVSGRRLRTLSVPHPVGLVWTNRTILPSGNETLIVGSSDLNQLWIVDVHSWTVQMKLVHPDLSHPAGILLIGSSQVLTFSQDTREIYSWNLSDQNSTTVVGQIWTKDTPHRPECFALVTC